MKRIISILIAFILCSTFSFAVFAEEKTEKLDKLFYKIGSEYEQVQKSDISVLYQNNDKMLMLLKIDNFCEQVGTAEKENIKNVEKELADATLIFLTDQAIGEETLEKATIREQKYEYKTNDNGIEMYVATILMAENIYEKVRIEYEVCIFLKDGDLYSLTTVINQDDKENVEKAKNFENTFYFEKDEIKILVNGEIVESDSSPLIENDRTIVPIRAVAEKLGYKVKWNEEERMVEISGEDVILLLGIGKENMIKISYEAQEIIKLDVVPKIINDRTYIPLRAVGEALGADVDWNPEERTVIIQKIKE